MKEMHELRDKLCNELKEYGKKEMSAGSLDVIDKLAHTVKNIDKIIDRDEGKGYSNHGYDGRRYPGNSYYVDGNSYGGYPYHRDM